MNSEPIPLTQPAEGVPEVIASQPALDTALEQLAEGTGPVAADAERASGFRYGQAAYLIQLRRQGAGTLLLDPTQLSGLEQLTEATGDAEWVLHAASQDLPCLREVNVDPPKIFDTELAGRLLGVERVGLSTMVEEFLGYQLAKEHSAADWSTRPIPNDWLIYAALDVEVLIELRDLLEAELTEQGKLEWALQEFEAVLAAPPPTPKPEPWRRIAGKARITVPSQLAIIRELWLEREQVAQEIDLAPGRVLSDTAIAAAATARVPGNKLKTLPPFRHSAARRRMDHWERAMDRGLAVPSAQWPSRRGPAHQGPPPPRIWREKNPEAFARLNAVKEYLAQTAEENNLPQENLLTPAIGRSLAWEPPEPNTPESVAEQLLDAGARNWQVEIVSAGLSEALKVEEE